MSVYLGSLGRLIELPYVSSHTMEPADRYSFERMLEGRVRAQVRPVGRRTWSLSGFRYLADSQGTLMSFINGEWGNGPFVWVPADAPVTNMLTPAVSACGPEAAYQSAVSVAGPLAIVGEGLAGRSLANSNTAANLTFGNTSVPVLPGEPVTASAGLLGLDAQMGVSFYTAAGTYISAALSMARGVAAEARRISVTATAPANAAYCRIYGVKAMSGARPALTWTDRVFEWADGQGCPAAVVHAASKDLQSAHLDPNGYRAATMPFTITEVG